MLAVKLAYDLYVPKDGDSKKCPIIMMHGLFMNRTFLKDMAEKLSNAIRRKVYCVDLRSHGGSPSPDQSNCYLMAEDLNLFLQDHNIPKASFVCHSFSSRPGVVFAIDYPDFVEKLVIIDFFPYADLDKKYNEFTNNMTLAIMQIAGTVDLSHSTEDIKKDLRVKLTQHKQTGWVHSFLELFLRECVKDEQGLRLKYDREATLKFFLEGRYRLPPYGSYDGPVLFVVAGRSTFLKNVLRSGEDIKDFFPKAEFLTIDDASHLVPIEKPEECVEGILKFLEA